ncbi:hypothetical protein [uncultured Demequina sp.]|uniref:hypothetical protein n=1 Tax=uncultured Demequina sp. TaxID=693499 RepID=UPI0025F2958E|nr:hypothetical protein [uncultured Demequina sp.]
MVNEDQVVSELLISGLSDWVSLHDVVWFCTEGAINDQSKASVLRVLDRLYADGLVVPGDLGETGFEDWQTPPDGWGERSSDELEQLNWQPMGAGLWLRLTAAGTQVARECE